MRLNKQDYDYAVQCLKRYDYNKANSDSYSKEYNAVEQAKLLWGQEEKYIFEEEFRKKRYRWDIMTELGMSEKTYRRRRKNLIYTVDENLTRN